MTLVITIFAALIATIIWYFNDNSNKYRLGTLSLIYWGASLMWFIDFVFEYAELKADYFVQEIGDIINDSLLGICVVALGLIAWVVIILIKDPKNKLFKKTN